MFNVNEEIELLEFLYKNIKKSKNTVKNILKDSTYVNNKKISKYNYVLKNGDIVSFKEKSEFDILYEDKDLIVINKPSGLLTISTEKEKDKTLYHLVSNYVKEKNKNNKIFVVHRLDRDTSGVVVFAKNEKIKKVLQDNWNDIVILRNYVAIVDGITKDSGTIKNYLKENNSFIYVSKDGKEAITHYKKIKSNTKYSLLDINIETGRKNQIRVQLSNLGYPILGDKKYGKKNEKIISRLALHANILEFINPLTKKKMRFETEIPSIFYKIVK